MLQSMGSQSVWYDLATEQQILKNLIKSLFCHLINYKPNLISVKAMATHSSTLAWEIPWTEELGRLQSMGSRRVGHNWANALSLFSFMHWRGKWQPSAVFLPGEYQGQGSLVGCCLWSSTELDMTEVTWQQQQQQQESFEASCGHCGGREC